MLRVLLGPVHVYITQGKIFVLFVPSLSTFPKRFRFNDDFFFFTLFLFSKPIEPGPEKRE